MNGEESHRQMALYLLIQTRKKGQNYTLSVCLFVASAAEFWHFVNSVVIKHLSINYSTSCAIMQYVL